MLYPHSAHQVPVDIFFSQEYHDLDQRMISGSAQYVGHESTIPTAGDYRSLYWQDHSNLLVRNPDGVRLVSNVCRHRQGIMLKGRGNTDNIVCPLHRWTYDTSGRLLGAPYFQHRPDCDLPSEIVYSYQGLCFRGSDQLKSRLSSLPVLGNYDFSDYHLRDTHVEHYDFDWKIFMEVYLDLYHVNASHYGVFSVG